MMQKKVDYTEEPSKPEFDARLKKKSYSLNSKYSVTA
jgi:hypothetical protein